MLPLRSRVRLRSAGWLPLVGVGAGASVLAGSCLLLFAGCDTGAGTDELDPALFTDDECNQSGATRCEGDAFQSCEQWRWYNRDACAGDLLCVEDLGCAACDPFAGPTCVGDDVHACRDDGSIGGFLEACSVGLCNLGYCQQSDCPPETQLIYLLDNQRRLLSFDPADEAFTFEVLGTINCPTDPPLEGWGTAETARPNSMSVDRSGTAWVAWTSGQIAHIPIRDPDQCVISDWVPQTGNFERFGMGFVTDAPGSFAETLFLSGGTVADLAVHLPSRTGSIDPDTLAFTALGTLPQTENNLELTGTGLAEWWGYSPGAAGNEVVQLDKEGGGFLARYPLPPLADEVGAWAFAHWGGQYYLFVTLRHSAVDFTPQVLRFDPATGLLDTVVAEHAYTVVGAGVSTCAPVVLQ